MDSRKKHGNTNLYASNFIDALNHGFEPCDCGDWQHKISKQIEHIFMDLVFKLSSEEIRSYMRSYNNRNANELLILSYIKKFLI